MLHAFDPSFFFMLRYFGTLYYCSMSYRLSESLITPYVMYLFSSSRYLLPYIQQKNEYCEGYKNFTSLLPSIFNGKIAEFVGLDAYETKESNVELNFFRTNTFD